MGHQEDQKSILLLVLVVAEDNFLEQYQGDAFHLRVFYLVWVNNVLIHSTLYIILHSLN